MNPTKSTPSTAQNMTYAEMMARQAAIRNPKTMRDLRIRVVARTAEMKRAAK